MFSHPRGILVFVSSVILLWGVSVHAVPTIQEDGALVKGSGPRVYVISKGERVWIQSAEDFTRLHFPWNRIRVVGDDELLRYPRALEVVNVQSGYPDYTLVKGTSPKVYIILNHERRWAKTISVVTGAGLNIKNTITLTDAEVESIHEGVAIVQLLPPTPETTMIAGPAQGSSIENVDLIFGYRGVDAHGGTDVTFETKLEGLDTNWVSAGSTVERLVRVPPLPYPYAFFVRAKDRNGNIDRTPAYRVFQVVRSSSAGRVRVSTVNAGTEVPSTEYVILSVEGEESVNLTGWRIRNNRGGSYDLGNVVDDYTQQGSFDQQLVVPSQGRVVINMGRSPVSKNFRTNMCTGYLERLAPFNPPLIQLCPLPSQAVMSNFSNACATYLQGLRRCAPPATVSAADQQKIGTSCVEFAVEHWSYTGCRQDHRSEPSFFDKEWRVFLNLSGQFLASDHDTVSLVDPKGKIVDVYKY